MLVREMEPKEYHDLLVLLSPGRLACVRDNRRIRADSPCVAGPRLTSLSPSTYDAARSDIVFL
jgi:hypothetical protein